MAALGAQIKKRLSKESISLGTFVGGAQLKLQQEHLKIDISQQALEELVASFLAEEFRAKVFA